MIYSNELKQQAYDIVTKSKKPWFSSREIIENLESEGFIVKNTISNESSNLVFTKDRTIKVISLDDNLTEKMKIQKLLLYYGYYKFTPTSGAGFVTTQQSDIKGSAKNQAKRLGILLREYSVEKQFDPELFKDKNSLFQKKKVI